MTKLSPNVKLVIFSYLDAKTVFLKMSLISKIDRKKIKEYFLLDHLRKGSKRIDICYNWFLDEDKESIWSEYQYCIFKEICFSLLAQWLREVAQVIVVSIRGFLRK